MTETVLDSLYQKSLDYKELKEDFFPLSMGQLRLAETGGLLLPPDKYGQMPPMILETNAWDQLMTKLAPAVYGPGTTRKLPSDYLLAIPNDLRAANLNHLFGKAKLGQSAMVRTVRSDPDGNGGSKVRAILHGEYPRVDTDRVIEATKLALEKYQVRPFGIVRPELTTDHCRLRLETSQSPDGHYSEGFVMGTDEIGRGNLIVAPFFKKGSCDNTTVWLEGGVSHPHTRGMLDELVAMMVRGIARAVKMADELLSSYLMAVDEPLPDLAKVIAGLAKQRGWNTGIQHSISAGTERQETRGGLVDGLTWASHQQNNLEVCWEMETLAGKLLGRDDNGHWSLAQNFFAGAIQDAPHIREQVVI